MLTIWAKKVLMLCGAAGSVSVDLLFAYSRVCVCVCAVQGMMAAPCWSNEQHHLHRQWHTKELTTPSSELNTYLIHL